MTLAHLALLRGMSTRETGRDMAAIEQVPCASRQFDNVHAQLPRCSGQAMVVDGKRRDSRACAGGGCGSLDRGACPAWLKIESAERGHMEERASRCAIIRNIILYSSRAAPLLLLDPWTFSSLLWRRPYPRVLHSDTLLATA